MARWATRRARWCSAGRALLLYTLTVRQHVALAALGVPLPIAGAATLAISGPLRRHRLAHLRPFSSAAKVYLSLLMLVGRLEVFAFVLFRPDFGTAAGTGA